MKKTLFVLCVVLPSALGWGSATNDEEVVRADLSAASFHPRQLSILAIFLAEQADQAKDPIYKERFESTAKILETTRETLNVFYKPAKIKAQGRGGKVVRGQEEKFSLPMMGQRDNFEKLTSGVIVRIYNSLCLVLPDMAERAFGQATTVETEPLFRKHKNIFDIYGRFCHFYVEALCGLHPASPLAKGALAGPLPGNQTYPLLYVKEGDEYLLTPFVASSSPEALGFNYFAPTLTRPYTSSGILYDKDGQVTRGWGLVLNFVPGHEEIVERVSGPERRLLEWHVRLYSPEYRFSAITKMFETGYFFTENKPYRETHSQTPAVDEAMVDTLFSASVRAFIEQGEKNPFSVVEYLPLPTTSQDQRVWRLLTLEVERLALLEVQRTHPTIEVLEEGADASAELTPFAQEIDQVTAEIENIEAQLYDDDIRAQQEAISARVAKSARETASKPMRGGKGRGAKRGTPKAARVAASSSSGAVVPLEPTPDMVAAAKARVEALKLEGRVKWRSLLGYVGKLTREGLVRPDDVRVSGSHVTVHTQGGASVTLVRPHGRRDAVHGRVAGDALMQLILSSQNPS